MPNRLSTQTSPYLLQHAANPVDWHPWDEHALQLARESDKPILLSIGYSACHWCHVMERESFEDERIAALMNERYVCIKVDREERPDLDKIYQTAHQMLSQRPGGWPLTVVLTPGGHAPFFAGTYFPPRAKMGMPGFDEVIEKVAAHYQQHRAELADHHRPFADAMAQINPRTDDRAAPDIARALNKSVADLAQGFDAIYGGFGGAPKFPHPTQLELLLRHSLLHRAGGSESDGGNDGNSDGESNSNSDNQNQSATMLHLSLRNMAQGGLFDQLGGGFYRYSVDRQWCIPHFEKMLYDNAQLLALYATAARAFDDSFYQSIAEQTADWVMREMQQAHGGYASTLDADSEGVEGKYYVWDESELRALLTDDEYASVKTFYDFSGEPNFEGQWHLNIAANDQPRTQVNTVARAQGRAKVNAAAHAQGRAHVNAAALTRAKQKLLETRNTRIRPALDDKILTAWNGMMIKGMARTARLLGRNDCIASAQNAVDFIRENCWRNGRLLVTTRNGKAHLNGYLDDYAFLAEGIVELLQAEWRSEDLAFAVQICDAMRTHFEDAEGGFFFTSHDHEKLLHRPKTAADDAIPSGNAAATQTLLQLGALLGNTDYLQSAENTLQLFATPLTKSPAIHGALTAALQTHTPTHRTIILRTTAPLPPTWQTALPSVFAASTYVIPADAQLPDALALRKPKGAVVAYVCQGVQCSAAIGTVEELVAVCNDVA